MSYKVTFFGVPGDASVEEVRAQLDEMADELCGENDYPAMYLSIGSDQLAAVTRLRPFVVLATGAEDGVVSRSFFIERWQGPLFEMVFDNQHGIYLFGHYPGEAQPSSILSDGHRVGFYNLTTAVDYPQRGFTVEQLDGFVRKDPDELSDAEANAVMDWRDAITIGYAHFGIGGKRNDLLDLLHVETAWRLGDGVVEALPRDAAPIADWYIEPSEFAAHGLPRRDY